MSRPVAAVVGVASLVPLAYLWFFLSVVRNRAIPGHERDYPLEWLFPMHLGVMGLSFLLIALYIYAAVRAKHLSELKRILWAVAVLFGSGFVFPLAWYFLLWRRAPVREGRSGAL